MYPPDASAADVIALACRRGEHDRGRLVAVELHGQLCRRDVHARCRCGRLALAHNHHNVIVTSCCAADPCPYANDGQCDVPRFCSAGDYLDCRTVGPVVSGTLPDTIGSLACRSKITSVCARQPARRCSRHPTPLSAGPCTSPPTHAARRVIAGYPGVVGSVPPTISALTALTAMCVPFAQPGSPPTRRLHRFASVWAVPFRRGRMLRFARSGP